MSSGISPDAAPRTQNAKVRDLVAEFAEEKQHEVAELAKATAPGRGRKVMVAVLTLVCGAAWLAPIPAATALQPVPQAQRERDATMALFLLASQITEFNNKHGRLPKTLGEVGIADSATYLAGALGEFTLRIRAGDRDVEYDSARPFTPAVFGGDSVLKGLGK